MEFKDDDDDEDEVFEVGSSFKPQKQNQPKSKLQTAFCFKIKDNAELKLGIAISLSLANKKELNVKTNSRKISDFTSILTGEDLNIEIEARASRMINSSFAFGDSTNSITKTILFPSVYPIIPLKLLCWKSCGDEEEN